MSHSRAFFVQLILSLGAFLLASPVRGEAKPPSKEEIAATAAWFDSLEWPDLTGKPYVEIVSGKVPAPPPAIDGTELPRMAGDDKDKAQARAAARAVAENAIPEERLVDGPAVRGFLLAEDDKGFTVFLDGVATRKECALWYRGWPLAVQRIPKSWQGAPPSHAVTSRVIALPAAVAEAIAAAHRPVDKDELERRAKYPPRATPGVALFALARCCARAGRADLAAQLDTELTTLAEFSTDPVPAEGRKPAPFRAAIEDGIAHSLMGKAMEDCGKSETLEDLLPPAVTREAWLAEYARIERDFPGSADHTEASRLAGILRKMVTEDKAHAQIEDQAYEKMTRTQQAREVIFQLRDENDHPGFMTDMPSPSGVQQLERLGFVAVPALLEIVGDERLTRTVEASRPGKPSLIVTYGDCALEALGRIAGREFATHEEMGRPVHDAAKTQAARGAIEAWWKGAQATGEKGALVEGVRAGGVDAIEKARRLIELDPAAAVAAMAVGMKASKPETTVRMNLLSDLGGVKSKEATAVLREEMLHGPDFSSRVAVAWTLRGRGNAKEATAAMVEEFRKWKPIWVRHDGIDMHDPDRLIIYLATCGDMAAMKALAEGMERLPAKVRVQIADSVVTRDNYNPDLPIPPEVDVRGERIAALALEDREAEGERRVCDVAAEALSKRWPERYSFKYSTTSLERDPQILALSNQWRTDHGLKARPVPGQAAVGGEAKRDPNTVAACHWHGGKALEGFPAKTGQPMTAMGLLAGLDRLQKALPETCTRIKVSAERAGDGRGFVVNVEWVPGKRPKHTVPGGWFEQSTDYWLDVRVAGREPFSSNGRSASEHSYYTTEGEFARAIDAALKSEPEKAVAIYFTSLVGP